MWQNKQLILNHTYNMTSISELTLASFWLKYWI